MEWWRKFDPDNRFVWWQTLGLALGLAAFAAGVSRAFYRARGHDVPDEAVVGLMIGYIVAFLLVSGVDRRFSSQSRALASLFGIGLGTCCVVVGSLFTQVF